MESYAPARSASAALVAPDWHASCPGVDVRDLAGRPFLWCPGCRCLVSLEAVAIKAEPMSTFGPVPEPTPTAAAGDQ